MPYVEIAFLLYFLFIPLWIMFLFHNFDLLASFTVYTWPFFIYFHLL